MTTKLERLVKQSGNSGMKIISYNKDWDSALIDLIKFVRTYTHGHKELLARAERYLKRVNKNDNELNTLLDQFEDIIFSIKVKNYKLINLWTAGAYFYVTDEEYYSLWVGIDKLSEITKYDSKPVSKPDKRKDKGK